MEYRFTFVVGGVNVDDDSIVTALMEHLDATLARAGGLNLLVMSADGSDAIDAARNAVLGVKFHVPQLQVLRLDRDLVGISEIAERTGRSRQNVTQWVTGERRSDAEQSFPVPETVVGRARIWLWTEVNSWLRNLGLGDDEALPTRTEMNDIDYMLRHNNLLPLDRPRAQLTWPVGYVGLSSEPGTVYVGRVSHRSGLLNAFLHHNEPSRSVELLSTDFEYLTRLSVVKVTYSASTTPTFVTESSE